MAATKRLSLLLPFFNVCTLLPASRTCRLALLCPCSGAHQTCWCLNLLPQQKTIHVGFFVFVFVFFLLWFFFFSFFLHVFYSFTGLVSWNCCMARCICSSAGARETMGTCSWKWGEGDVEGELPSFCSLEKLDLFSPVLSNCHMMP